MNWSFSISYCLFRSLFIALVFAAQVIAIDEEQTSFASTATVTIRIIDANDNIPKFPEDTYKLNVAENSATGTDIKAITVGALLV